MILVKKTSPVIKNDKTKNSCRHSPLHGHFFRYTQQFYRRHLQNAIDRSAWHRLCGLSLYTMEQLFKPWQRRMLQATIAERCGPNQSNITGLDGIRKNRASTGMPIIRAYKTIILLKVGISSVIGVRRRFKYQNCTCRSNYSRKLANKRLQNIILCRK